jgi:hypothetical protein
MGGWEWQEECFDWGGQGKGGVEERSRGFFDMGLGIGLV